MFSKLTFAVGFGVGYVLGSRAGRQRYEQIARLARKVKDSPAVQGAAGTLQAQAENAISTVRHKLGNESNGDLIDSPYADRLNGATNKS